MNEKDLSLALGLSRDFLREVRSSYENGLDWVKIPSKKPEKLWKVEWTDAGIEKLKNTLNLLPEDKVDVIKEITGIVTAKHKNTRVLSVLVDGVDGFAICRDSTKFGIGMNVLLKWDGGRWAVARHPRFNGKY